MRHLWWPFTQHDLVAATWRSSTRGRFRARTSACTSRTPTPRGRAPCSFRFDSVGELVDAGRVKELARRPSIRAYASRPSGATSCCARTRTTPRWTQRAKCPWCRRGPPPPVSCPRMNVLAQRWRWTEDGRSGPGTRFSRPCAREGDPNGKRRRFRRCASSPSTGRTTGTRRCRWTCRRLRAAGADADAVVIAATNSFQSPPTAQMRRGPWVIAEGKRHAAEERPGARAAPAER